MNSNAIPDEEIPDNVGIVSTTEKTELGDQT